MKILVAEDHSLFREGITTTLERDGGFDIVATAATGPEVMPLVNRKQPEAVLLDLRMPGVDGLSLLTQIAEKHPKIKVVICSCCSDTDTIQAAFKRGAAGYILKTIGVNDLASAIRQAVQGTAFHAQGLPAMSEDSAAKKEGLTDREVEVLKAICSGKSNNQVAEELWVTLQTVKFHLTAIYRKLGVKNRTEAAAWALGKGLASGKVED